MIEYLEEKLKKQYGDISKIINGYNSKRKTTLRVNNLKSNIDEVKNELRKNNILFSEVSWYKDALIIDSEVNLSKLSLFIEGKIYLQSLSSMLPPLILNPSEGESILDMCAAPGSKTTELANITNDKARIMAVEKDKIRFEKLKYNIQKQGFKSINVINMDATLLDDYFLFDKILLDAPCSGSGTINQNNIKYFSEKLVNNSKIIQIKLLKKAIKLLKVGGEIVYSTCSILEDENESVLNEILKDKNIELVNIENKELPCLKTSINGTLCICPISEYEGFFVAKLRKIK